MPVPTHTEHNSTTHGRDALDFTFVEAFTLLALAATIGLGNWLKAFPVTFVKWLRVWWIFVACATLSIGLVTYSFPAAIVGGFLFPFAASVFYHWYTVRTVS